MHPSALFRVILFAFLASSTLPAQQPAPGPLALPERGEPAAPPPMRKDETVTQIVPLRFVEAAKLVEHLRPLLAETATIRADERTNSIMLTDTRTNVRRIAQMLTLIDEGTAGVRVSTDVPPPPRAPGAAAPGPASSTTSTAAAPISSGDKNEVLKRMIERRAKEMSK